MSWKHISAAFQYRGDGLSETALHVLLRIAWEMRDNDYAFPGTAYLAERLRVSRKTVQRAVNELAAAGAITVRSGRFSGHRNHYYLTFPGAPAVDIVDGGGTNPPSSVPPPVDNSWGEVGQMRPHEREVGQTRPDEVGQPELPLGQILRGGWDKTDHGEKKIKQENIKREISLSQAAQNVPPPAFDDGPKQKLPPVGTIEFKSYAVRFCLDAGASLEEARGFYEYHQAENWTILEHLPLEIAAMQWVKTWRKRDPRGWTLHQLAELRRKEQHS